MLVPFALQQVVPEFFSPIESLHWVIQNRRCKLRLHIYVNPVGILRAKMVEYECVRYQQLGEHFDKQKIDNLEMRVVAAKYRPNLQRVNTLNNVLPGLHFCNAMAQLMAAI